MRPRNVALRDQLLALLRDHPEGMDMQQILKAVNLRACDYGQVYSNLRAMDRLRLVVWHDWMGWSCGCTPEQTGDYPAHRAAVHFTAAPYDAETGIDMTTFEELLKEGS